MRIAFIPSACKVDNVASMTKTTEVAFLGPRNVFFGNDFPIRS